MLTISQLAKKFSISRTTVLYYEREGLLLPKTRSDNGYRWYGDFEVERLRKIMAYRSFGVPVAQLYLLLDRNDEVEQQTVLLEHFHALEAKVQQLRVQQKAIVQFMGQPELLEESVVTKERWTQIMRDAGLSDDDMRNWHMQFEKSEPQGHLVFLRSLNIPEEEIEVIRGWSD